MDWQPIETAPKDGRFIIVLRPGHVRPDHLIGLDAWSDSVNGWVYSSLLGIPTHWMPLPAPPVKS